MAGVLFHLKQYDSEAVAFDSASGDTHYLSPLALMLYHLYCDHPGVSRNEAKRLLEERHGVEHGTIPNAQFDDTLDGLCQVGLIRIE